MTRALLEKLLLEELKRTPPPAPTIEQMRSVAYYLSDVLNLHSAAGKLLKHANKLEQLVTSPMPVEHKR